MPRPKLIAFDFFGTLAANEVSEWIATFGTIVQEQSLAIAGSELHAQWSKREQQFRLVRTNMKDPLASPPFRTYWQAWRDAFAETFAALGLPGDVDAAATRCVDDHCSRKAFGDANTALIQLVERAPLSIMSNADDVFLDGSIAFNGWAFDPVISSEGARAYKPDRRAFAALCTASGVAAGDVLYVGDSPYDDAHGAKLAGMQTVLINREQHTLGRTPPPDAVTLLAPDHEIQSLIELPALLDALAKVRTTP
jgi:2-haloalkanoic acid dehalogenase type II